MAATGYLSEPTKGSGWISSTISPVIPQVGDFPANADFVFAGHYEVNGAAVTFGGLNLVPGTARFTAKDDPDVNNVVNDGVVDPITSVAISFGGETKFVVLASFVSPVIVGGRSFTIQDPA